jgi:DHA1 family tetracycline resistance protein-like MFS transporter
MSQTGATKPSGLPAIFLTIFIDMLGIGVVVPVLPALFFEADTPLFGPEWSAEAKSICYGFLLAAYPIMQFFGAPMLGSLSDRYGRKPMLMGSLAGTFLGYLIFAFAVKENNLTLLFLSRMLPGFTGGNISIVFSSIADISDPSSRARNFGLVGMAFGLGFILGPTIGGILADSNTVSWFDAATPFYFTALLTLLNILLVQFRFGETLANKRASAVSLFTGFHNIARSFADPSLRGIFSIVLLLSLGFTFFTQFFSVLLIEKFGLSEKNIGFLFGWIGLWLVFTQGVTVRLLSRRFESTRILRFSIFFLSLALAALLLPTQSWMFFLLNPMIATFQGITAPNLTATVSNQAGTQRQGEILGINQSMQSLGQAIPPIIGGYLHAINGYLPLVTAALLTFAGWLGYMLVFRRISVHTEQ